MARSVSGGVKLGHGGGYGGGKSGGGIAARRARTATKESEYLAIANDYVRSRLEETARRDHGETREIIDSLVDGLNQRIAGRADAVYGGSTAKGTFVEGISDYDVLVRVQETELAGKGPRAALDRIAAAAQATFPDAKISVGKMAVTVTMNSKEYQAVPALRAKNGDIRLPEPGRNAWSNVTQPRKFADRFTAANQRHDGMVKQTTRTFKLMQEKQLPKDSRLIGYHVEAIAYLAFRSQKPRETTHTRMLEDMTKAASHLVRQPITDRTGQNRHVDDHLGPANSKKRQRVAHELSRLAKKMQRARESGDAEAWRSVL